MLKLSLEIDDTNRVDEIRYKINRKKSLKKFYIRSYKTLQKLTGNFQKTDTIVEIGAGASFANQYCPNIILTDILPYKGIHKVIDATKMDFQSKSIHCFFLMNVLHHIPDAKKFFNECDRCLIDGGKIYIIDQYPSIIGKFILKYFHHEPFNEKSIEWSFQTTGPLSGANGALAWIIFFRDLKIFHQEFPQFDITHISIHTPFYYWLTGGLKNWNLIPFFFSNIIMKLDNLVSKIFPKIGCFMDIIIEKKELHFDTSKKYALIL